MPVANLNHMKRVLLLAITLLFIGAFPSGAAAAKNYIAVSKR